MGGEPNGLIFFTESVTPLISCRSIESRLRTIIQFFYLDIQPNINRPINNFRVNYSFNAFFWSPYVDCIILRLISVHSLRFSRQTCLSISAWTAVLLVWIRVCGWSTIMRWCHHHTVCNCLITLFRVNKGMLVYSTTTHTFWAVWAIQWLHASSFFPSVFPSFSVYVFFSIGHSARGIWQQGPIWETKPRWHGPYSAGPPVQPPGETLQSRISLRF